ncbi:MAG: EamA family transporter [Patescibacteria group bacterium]|nr:MAG: EamA family transporter [Patescibacteria group bacterium]
MNWFLIALIGPFLWCISNYIDKYLLSSYFNKVGIGALIIFSALIGLIVSPLILLFKPEVLIIGGNEIIWMITAGIILMLSFLLYLYALDKDEASIVAPLFQTIPIFLYILGYIFLKETLSSIQLSGGFLIMIGGIAIAWNIELRKLKGYIFLMMMVASLLLAAEGTIFKVIALETDFWTVVFWQYIGATLFGALLLFIPNYRRQFFSLWKKHKAALLSINFINEAITTIGILTFRFAMLLAPLALVQMVNGFQPLFLLVIGLLLTKFWPKITKERIDKKHLIHKLTAIIIMIAGSFMINF